MVARKNLLILLLMPALMLACKSKKKVSLSGDDPVEINDFIEFFQPLQMPAVWSDSILLKKDADSLLISYKVFTQFVPDSVLAKTLGKNAKPKLYPFGKVAVKGGETYLFVKAVHNGKKTGFLLAFSKSNAFIAGMPVLQPDQSAATAQSVFIDKRLTINKSVMRRNPDGTFSDGKDVFVLNEAANSFMLIMTEALEDKVTELINPIDTLGRKHKLSADYANGKMNLVSIRDSKKPDRLTFFIHFENGDCNGELKGEAFLRGPNRAEYTENGDPCKLSFIFSGNSVTLNEEEGCGSHRGLRCSFNGSFARKKYVKPGANKRSPNKK